MSDQRIKDKIAKLLTLATESSNANERESAMRKAFALMEKHGVSEGEANRTNMISGDYYHTRKRPPVSDSWIASAIANLTGTFQVRTVGTNEYTFCGQAKDVDLAIFMTGAVINQMDHFCAIYKASKGVKVKELNDYRTGLALGFFRAVTKTLKERREQQEAGTGLIPVDDRTAKAEQFFLDQGESFSTTVGSVRNSAATAKGLSDSGKLNASQGVNGEAVKLLA